MPRLSEFFGIVISMYYKEHGLPHFHVAYAQHEATVGIDPIRILQGHLPRRIRGFVFEWAATYQPELRHNWELARAKEALQRIPPLD